jgi:hypothetical protein
VAAGWYVDNSPYPFDTGLRSSEEGTNASTDEAVESADDPPRHTIGVRGRASGRPIWQYFVTAIVAVALVGAALFVLWPSSSAYFNGVDTAANEASYPRSFYSDWMQDCGPSELCSCHVRTIMKSYTYQEYVEAANGPPYYEMGTMMAIRMFTDAVCADPVGRAEAGA